jgi:hypothetical protein
MSGTGVATFSFDDWLARYPEFQDVVSKATATAMFAEATLYLAADASSPVADVGQRTVILGMITAHIAALSQRDLVGRISNASEGTVSVQTDMGPPSGSAAWWQQTRSGASAWQALAGLRTMHYLPGPAVRPRGWPYGLYGGFPGARF